MGIFNSYVSFPEGHIPSNRPLKSQRKANVDVVFQAASSMSISSFSAPWWFFERLNPSYPLVNIQKTMENHQF